MQSQYPTQLTDYQGSLFRRFTGKEKDSESGYYYFGARYFMPSLSIWNSVDPMADKYPSLSPYNYCAWNPMKLVDPNGEEIDISALYAKNKDGSYKYKNLIKAFEKFAQTKIGQKELAKYAKSGQTIAGIVYETDGEYHKKGIDISFGGEVSRAYYSGDIGRKIENTRLGISINVASTTNEGDIFEAICHELFIHSRQAAYDYIDDHKLNHSYLNKHLK